MPMQSQQQSAGGLIDFLQMLAQQYQQAGGREQGISNPASIQSPPMNPGQGPGGMPMGGAPPVAAPPSGPAQGQMGMAKPPQGQTPPMPLGPHPVNGEQDPAIKARLLETLMRIKQQQQGGPGIGQQQQVPFNQNMMTP
jgi:hypothetical protein